MTKPRLKFVAVIGACVLAWPRALWTAAQPLSLHPENPHYFLFRGKPTILITSGEHYGAVLNLAFNYLPYLDELHAHGLNHTRTFSGTYREVPSSFGITENTLAPKPGQFISPWARSETPGSSDGGNKFDLTKWNPAYFERLKDFVSQASRRDIVVEMSLFCPMYEDALWAINPMNDRNNVNGIGKCPRTEVYNLSHPELTAVQRAVSQKIVETLRVTWTMCTTKYETSRGSETSPRTGRTKSSPPSERPEGVHFPARHLISQNITKQKITHPNPAVSIFNFHYAAPPDVISQNYGLNVALGDNETGFRGKDNVCYRTEAWDCFLAGAALYSSLDYSFVAGHPDGTFLQYESPGGGNPELRRQLGVLRRFLENFNLVRMSPDASVMKGGVAPGWMSARALSEKGRAYAIYVRRRTNADRFHARWNGLLTWPTNGAVSLHLASNQGVKLWVDGTLAIDDSKTHEKTEDEVKLTFPAGRTVPIQLELYQARVGSVLRLSWSGDGLKKEIVPAGAFSAAGGKDHGLKGDYFEERSMSGLILTRNDPVIDFDWSRADPFMGGAVRQPVELAVDLPAGHYDAAWVEPVSGKVSKQAELSHAGGETVLTSPEFDEDVALTIKTAK